jgi:hypothetical protein
MSPSRNVDIARNAVKTVVVRSNGNVVGTTWTVGSPAMRLTSAALGGTGLIYLHYIPGTVRTLDTGINPARQIG